MTEGKGRRVGEFESWRVSERVGKLKRWIPAYAGMTEERDGREDCLLRSDPKFSGQASLIGLPRPPMSIGVLAMTERLTRGRFLATLY